MRKLKVNLGERSYQILIGDKILDKTGDFVSKSKLGKDAFIITNRSIKKIYGKRLKRSLNNCGIKAKFRTVADSERSKSMPVVISLIKDITAYDKKKNILIIALGGGVIGDLAGFVASIYKRGVAYIQIPTTLLSQIDSSIGGKTAVDLMQAKNLVGAFYQPRLVISDVSCLKTLNFRQVRSGLAEAIKYGIIKDKALFNYIQRYSKQLINREIGKIENLVFRCSRIKAGVVQADEKEKRGIRTILNFGHTIGHAIEAASNYQGYNHGEAISIGMICATDISRQLSLITSPTFKKIEKIILKVGLPTKIKGVSYEKILKAHYRDKKFLGKRNRFVLIKDIGKTVTRLDIPLKIIKVALSARF